MSETDEGAGQETFLGRLRDAAVRFVGGRSVGRAGRAKPKSESQVESEAAVEVGAAETPASCRGDGYAHLYRQAKWPVLVLRARDLRYADCNTAALRALRCESKGEVVGRSAVDFSPTYQPDGRGSVEKGAELMARVLGSRTARCGWIYRRKDGTDFAVDAVLSRIRVGTEALVYVRWLPAEGAEGSGSEGETAV